MLVSLNLTCCIVHSSSHHTSAGLWLAEAAAFRAGQFRLRFQCNSNSCFFTKMPCKAAWGSGLIVVDFVLQYVCPEPG
jgi:hypothetical protein